MATTFWSLSIFSYLLCTRKSVDRYGFWHIWQSVYVVRSILRKLPCRDMQQHNKSGVRHGGLTLSTTFFWPGFFENPLAWSCAKARARSSFTTLLSLKSDLFPQNDRNWVQPSNSPSNFSITISNSISVQYLASQYKRAVRVHAASFCSWGSSVHWSNQT